jgi:hypothetical protein
MDETREMPLARLDTLLFASASDVVAVLAGDGSMCFISFLSSINAIQNTKVLLS